MKVRKVISDLVSAIRGGEWLAPFTAGLVLLRRKREGQDINTFAADFGSERHEDLVIQQVYLSMQRWCDDVPGLPIRADDRLYETYGIGEYEDFEDVLIPLAVKCNRKWEPSYGDFQETVTVRDLVSLISRLPLL